MKTRDNRNVDPGFTLMELLLVFASSDSSLAFLFTSLSRVKVRAHSVTCRVSRCARCPT